MKSLYPLIIISLFFSFSAIAQPIVNLGQDTSLCGDSLVLDAGIHSGPTTYLWNTGETTQFVTIYTSDTFSVEVTDATGTSQDTIIVQLNNIPTLYLPTTDTNVCIGLATFFASGNANFFNWYDSSAAGNLVAIGDSINYNVTGNDTLWVEAFNSVTSMVGLQDPQGLGNYYNIPTTHRGITFKVNQQTNLRAVSLFTNGPLTVTIQIWLGTPGSGTLINSWNNLSLTSGGIERIELNQALSASATNYNITITKSAGAGLVYADVFPNASYWTNIGNNVITFIQGYPNALDYQRFYRWEIEVDRCISARQSIALNGLLTPSVSLPADTGACADSLTVTANISNATSFAWNTGETTNPITIYDSDTLILQADNGGTCFAQDTFIAQLSPFPVLSLPTTDTNICEGIASFQALGSADYFYWYDSSSAGNLIATGDSINYNVAGNDTLWVEGYNSVTTTVGLNNPQGLGNYYNIPTSYRGITFNINQQTNLRAVSLFTNGPLTVTIQIWLGTPGSGTLINSWNNLSLTSGGIERIALDQPLSPSATNYTITITKSAGTGEVYADVFPNAASWTGLGNNVITFVQGYPNALDYQRFYRWELEVDQCITPRQSLAINALLTPSVNLPADTATCADSLAVMGSIANATSFVWSTGETTNPITIYGSDTLILQANNLGTCFAQDTFIADLSPFPVLTLPVTDTSLCQGIASFQALGSADYFYWYDSSSAGNLIATGDSINYNVTTNDTLWVEAYNSVTTTVGLSDPQGLGNYYNIPTSYRGITFNINQQTNLRAVSLFTNGPLTVDIEIWLGTPGSGTLIRLLDDLSLTSGGIERIALDQPLSPSATNYTITITKSAGTGEVYADVFPNAASWTGLGNNVITFVQGYPNALDYQRFYRWELEVDQCISARQSLAINALLTPSVSLPADTATCADSLAVMGSIANATSFVWNTGETTNPITIYGSDTLILQADNLGTCFAQDTFIAELSPFPILTLPVTDTSLCQGIASLQASGSADYFYWYDSSSAGNIVAVGDTVNYNVTTNDTLWVEAYNSITSTVGLTDTLGLGNYYDIPTSYRGITFNINQPTYLRAVSLFTNGPLTVDIEIWLGTPGSGTLINSWNNLSLTSGGIERIVLDQALSSSATNYTITITKSAGTGEVYADIFPNAASWTDLGNDVITFIAGYPNTLDYQRFYRWEVEVDQCTSPRQSLAINALLTPSISLPADTAMCADSLAINASISNSTSFVWSTGETTNPITIYASDTLILQADNLGTCFAQDTFIAELSPFPMLSLPVTDTSLCLGIASLQASGNADYFYWYDSSSAGNIVAIGNNINYNVTNNDTLWAEGYNSITSTVGLIDTLGLGNYYNIPTSPRGITFNINQQTYLRAVSLFTNGPLTVDIQIWRGIVGSGTLINSWNDLSLTSGGIERIILDQALSPSATNYTITITKSAGIGSVYADVFPNAASWTGLGNDVITFVEGYPNALDYQRFYRWEIEVDQCTSPRQPLAISALPTPILSLPADTSICADSLIINASIINATSFAWSTGETTNPITIYGNDTLILQADNASTCFAQDTFIGELFPYPMLSLPVTDTTICAGISSFQALGNASYFYWYDSSTSGNLVAIGDNINYNVTNNDTLWVEGYNSITSTVGLTDPGSGNYFNLPASPRGITFNINQQTYLRAVSLFTNGPLTVDIQIWRGAVNTGVLINSWENLNLTSGGIERIVLDQALSASATNYTITINKISGSGAVYAEVFPSAASWASLGNNIITFVEGYPNALDYQRFYRWEIEVDQCTSPRQPLAINTLPTPVLNLPADTTVCANNLVLDAANSGASYLWSNGATTPSITVSTTDTFDILATIGACSTRDTSRVYFTPPSVITSLSGDTTSCAGLIDRTVMGSADLFTWYDSSSAGNIVGYGNIITQNITDTTTFWVEAANYNPRVQIVGEIDTNVTNTSGFFSTLTPAARGLVFNATTPLKLNSVHLYVASAPFFAVVQLWDANNNIVSSTPVAFSTAGKNKAILNFDILPGEYKLILTDVNGVDVYADYNYNFTTQPISLPELSITRGYPNGNNSYNCFYEWEIVTASCPSNRQSTTINILPTPTLNLPADTVICGSSVNLDVSTTNANTYLWSTGATTPNINLNNSDTVWARVTIGACSDQDTTIVTITQPPSSFIPPNDTVACGGLVTLKADGNAYTYLWYDNSTSSTPISVGDSINYNLTDSTTLWVEGVGFLSNAGYLAETSYTPQGSFGNPTSGLHPNRGLAFDVINPLILNSVNILVDSTTSATVVLRNTYGATIYSKAITIASSGEHTINLDWAINPGTGYQLTLENLNAKNLWFRYPYGFPIVHSDLIITNGLPNVGGIRDVYAYFFKWKVSTPSCATARVPVQIDVPPSPNLILPSDTAICNGSNIVLQATDTSSSYTYNWSTAETTNNISISTSGYYAVTATNNGKCPVDKDVFVQLLSTPNTPSIADTAICSSQYIDLLENPNDGILVWYDTVNTPIHISAPYNNYVGDTSEYVIQSAAHAVTRIGEQNYNTPLDPSVYQGFVIPNTFDVHEFAVLDSIAVYVNSPNSTFDIILQNSADSTLASRTITVANAFEKTFIPLNFVIPPGSGYKLSFANFSTKFLVDPNTQYPMGSSSNIATLTGTTFTGISLNCFFDWHFSYAYPTCRSGLDSFMVQIAMPVDLQDSVYTCDSLVLDLQHPNVNSYTWSTGATTPTITVNTSGVYVATISDGNLCTTVDSIKVDKPIPVGLPSNGVVCELVLRTNYSSPSSSFIWSTGSTTDVVNIPALGTYTVTLTTPNGCVLTESTNITQLENAPNIDLGGSQVACAQDTLDAGFGNLGLSYLWNTGHTTQTLVVLLPNVYSVTATTPNGCTATDFAYVDLDTDPIANFGTITSGSVAAVSDSSIISTPSGTDYRWDWGDNTPQWIGPNPPAHLYTKDTCYTITLYLTNSCGTDTASRVVGINVPDSTCMVVSTLSTPSAPKILDFNIIPNPNTGLFTLDIEGIPNLFKLQIYNVSGQVVYEHQQTAVNTLWDVDLNSLTSGMYFVRLISNKESKTKRMIIHRE
ncbi:MAG: T9SS type A sorting domain-containing protein [Aureispira sp.]|nr:T9SS type A sorting domain-containing protein [Aureispira sp.]